MQTAMRLAFLRAMIDVTDRGLRLNRTHRRVVSALDRKVGVREQRTRS